MINWRVCVPGKLEKASAESQHSIQNQSATMRQQALCQAAKRKKKSETVRERNVRL